MTPKEFAAHCSTPHFKLKTNRLSVEIDRGKVVVGDNGDIDPSHETNIAFKNRFTAKQANKVPQQIPRSETFVEPGSEENDGDADETGINKLSVSDERYKHFLALKTERAAELDRIKIEKLNGVLVPSAPIIPIILRHNQLIIQEQSNADQELLSLFAHKYDISPEDVAYYRGEQVKRRNAAAQRAAEMSEKSIASTINEFSERKRVA